jgi:hypothetical protein
MAQTFNDAVPASTRNALEDLTAIRNNFAALKSCFSGATAPPNPVAGMWWYDTTANILKLRNEANTAWLDVYDFANQRTPLALNCSRTVVGGTGISVSGSLNGGNATVSLATGGVSNTHVANATLGAEKFQTGTDERNWVLGRAAGASVGGVGTYAFARYAPAALYAPSLSPGDTVSGADLRYAGVRMETGTQGVVVDVSSPSLAGTWRCMGYAPITYSEYGSATRTTATLFLRIK